MSPLMERGNCFCNFLQVHIIGKMYTFQSCCTLVLCVTCIKIIVLYYTFGNRLLIQRSFLCASILGAQQKTAAPISLDTAVLISIMLTFSVLFYLHGNNYFCFLIVCCCNCNLGSSFLDAFYLTLGIYFCHFLVAALVLQRTSCVLGQ